MTKKRALRPEPTAVASMLDAQTILVADDTAMKAPLGPVERRLVAGMNGARTLADLAKLTDLTLHETTTVLGRLVQLGVARIEQEVALDDGWETEEPPSRNPTKRPPPDLE